MKMDHRASTLLGELDERSKREQAILAEARARGLEHVMAVAPTLMLDVGREVGQLLNYLIRLASAKTILEIGGSVGYSTIWMAEAAQATGGKVISIELDTGKHKEQAANLESVGLLQHVELINGDAEKELPSIPGPFDLVLIDHWKALYVREFKVIWPKMRKGGWIVADNIVIPALTHADTKAYCDLVRATPGARSYLLGTLGSGIEVTCRE